MCDEFEFQLIEMLKEVILSTVVTNFSYLCNQNQRHHES